MKMDSGSKVGWGHKIDQGIHQRLQWWLGIPWLFVLGDVRSDHNDVWFTAIHLEM